MRLNSEHVRSRVDAARREEGIDTRRRRSRCGRRRVDERDSHLIVARDAHVADANIGHVRRRHQRNRLANPDARDSERLLVRGRGRHARRGNRHGRCRNTANSDEPISLARRRRDRRRREIGEGHANLRRVQNTRRSNRQTRLLRRLVHEHHVGRGQRQAKREAGAHLRKLGVQRQGDFRSRLHRDRGRGVGRTSGRHNTAANTARQSRFRIAARLRNTSSRAVEPDLVAGAGAKDRPDAVAVAELLGSTRNRKRHITPSP